ncbi:MAG TPA: amidohydrolase [Candidatus Latescibacteria bacterium]|nr:amidohydrolase [Candidatus Latescibacterota bacterium]
MNGIIDVHTHAFADHIAKSAVEVLEKSAGIKAYLDGTVADLKRSMKEAGIVRSLVQPVATKPSQVKAINDWAHRISDGSIISFGTIHPLSQDWKEEIERLKRLGIPGVKFHPDYQDFYPDEVAMFPIYEALVANGLIVFFHAGVDIGLPPPVHGTPERIAKVLDNFPEMKVVAAHLGGYKMWDEVEDHLVGREIYLDTSYTIDYLDENIFLRIIKCHSIKKIVFGSDSPWKDQKREVQSILELDISDPEKEKILCTNAEDLLG